MLRGVQQVRKIPQFLDPKGFEECRQWHLEEGPQVNKAYLVKSQLQEFCPVADLLDDGDFNKTK